MEIHNKRNKKNKINVAALQMSSITGNPEQNRKKLSEIVEREIKSGIDFLILPEVWTSGWDCEEFPHCFEEISDSKTLGLLCEIAKKHSVNVIGGSFIEKKPNGKLYNTSPVINRTGKLITTYSKMHLYSYCGCTEGNYIEKGNSPVMVNIDGINVGLTICYDIRFPEIFGAYRKKGADLLVNMAAWGAKKPIPWETLTRARAIENQVYMAAVTQSGKIKGDEWNIGHSRIFDFVGETIAEIKNQKEGIVSCIMDIEKMYEYRKICPILKDKYDKYEVTVV